MTFLLWFLSIAHLEVINIADSVSRRWACVQSQNSTTTTTKWSLYFDSVLFSMFAFIIFVLQIYRWAEHTNYVHLYRSCLSIYWFCFVFRLYEMYRFANFIAKLLLNLWQEFCFSFFVWNAGAGNCTNERVCGFGCFFSAMRIYLNIVLIQRKRAEYMRICTIILCTTVPISTNPKCVVANFYIILDVT